MKLKVHRHCLGRSSQLEITHPVWKNKTGKAIGILTKQRPYIAYPLWWVCIILLFISTWCILYMFGIKTYASNLDCLNKFQKRIVRLISGVLPRDHMAPLFMKYGILQMSQIADYKSGIFMYEIYYQEVPAIFDNHFTLICDIHDCNTRQRCCIHCTCGSG